MRAFAAPRLARRRQRGVVLLFALIALLVLLIGAAAMVRSFNSSLFQAGNIGFKRDLQNQSELVTSLALQAFGPSASAPLASRTARSTSSSATSTTNAPQNGSYSATILSVDKQGIPDVLTRLDRTDQSGASPPFVLLPLANDYPGGSFTITYVIDRLCASAGDEKVLASAQCAVTQTPPVGNGLRNEQNSDSTPLASGLMSSAPAFVLYRLSAKITGPRNTVSFFQSTFAVPS